MENVAIFPLSTDSGAPLFRAVARTGRSEGRTAGEALDAIVPQLPQDSSRTMVVINPFSLTRFSPSASGIGSRS